MRIQDIITENRQGVAEGHADQQRTIVKRNGQPVGEIGIDRESSPGAGQYYMKHYASGTDLSGYSSREEALGDLRHAIKQGVREGSDEQVHEISDELLARYKEKAKADADELEANKEFRRATDRRMGIVRATGRQIAKTTDRIHQALNPGKKK